MKRLTVIVAICAVGLTAVRSLSALDAVQNDFWDTTGHVDAVPVTQDGTMAGTFDDGLCAAAAEMPEQGLDSWAWSVAFSVFDASKTFNSYKPIGLLIKFR